MSKSLANIKIPYASEGVIRTASLDDTVAPTDSAQVAVNMNFDRIGAFQTREGLEEYATQLTGEIKNFGTLQNSEIIDGFSKLAKIPVINDFPYDSSEFSSSKIDDTHFILFWRGNNKGKAQVVEVDLDSGTVTFLGTALEFDSVQVNSNSCGQIDANHFINFWTGASNAGKAQAFAVNLTTWAVTALGSKITFETDINSFNSCSFVDATHFINFWAGGASGITGKAQAFAIDGAFTVTAVGSPLTIDASVFAGGAFNSCGNIDNQHYINFWASTSGVGKTQVFNVDPSTYAVTALSSALTFDAGLGRFNSCAKVDASHFINFWSSTSTVGTARVFAINLSTFAVTTAGASLAFSTIGFYNSVVSMNDGIHFVNFFNAGQARIYEVDAGTFAITASSNLLTYSSISNQNSAIFVSSTRIINFWIDENSSPGASQAGVFMLFDGVQDNHYLYAQQGNSDVKVWHSAAWTTVRTGLATASKARFAQYLNYLWMVNGNSLLGDPVKTSNGGVFGTTLVPDNFPPGDFIQAGFEGRVWVADKAYDVVYFTDIVQFTPPNTYTLTYDPEINFIKNFSPQNGQSITGLFTTPRALLLFKQDSIYRIYGAYSADAYPAYNVGTYSQESVIQTKDGVYFHHSSGFYKFSYDTQPVEISRRVIDFVEAIPRENYEFIIGVYDGFDCIEWAVGEVVVEGVTYTNCVMRYTISTQVWTIYDYPLNYITAMIEYDDGTDLNMIMGTDEGKVLAMDSGYDDLGVPIYFEFIDRWRSFTDMYAEVKSISGLNLYNENGAGTKVMYQIQNSNPNDWQEIGTIGTLSDAETSLFPNAATDDFNVVRLRVAGFTKGTPMVFHGIELLTINLKGYDTN